MAFWRSSECPEMTPAGERLSGADAACCADPGKSVAAAYEWVCGLGAGALSFWTRPDSPLAEIAHTVLPPLAMQGLVGYDTSASAVALITAKTVGISHWSLDALCGAQLLGSVGGIVWVYWKAEDFGPGEFLLHGAGLYGAGALVMTWSHGLPLMLLSRAAMGAGIAIISIAVPWYMVEVAPATVRGSLAALHQTMFGLGLCGGAAGAALTYAIMGVDPNLPLAPLKAMYASALAPTAVAFLAMRTLPESHRWILMTGRCGVGQPHSNMPYNHSLLLDAQRSLVKTRGAFCSPTDIAKEVQSADTAIEKGLARLQRVTGRTAKELGAVRLEEFLAVPGVFTAFSTSAGVVLLKNLCGHAALFGIFVSQAPTVPGLAQAVAVVGLVKVASSLLVVPFLDTTPRARLMFHGTVALSTSFLAAGLGLDLGLAPLVTAGTVLNTLAFSVSLGPQRYLYPAEVLPLPFRAKGLAVLEGMDYLGGWCSVFLLENLAMGGGVAVASVFASACTIGLLVALRPSMPDTSHKALEDIEEEIARTAEALEK